MMATQRRRYRFVIDESFTPETLPMARLAEYMADLADLLGEKSAVHFVQVEGGSAVLVEDVEHEAYPKVRARVHDVKRGEGPPDARRAYESLNKKLAADNASGQLIEEPAQYGQLREPTRVLEFPGRRRFVELEYGPVGQVATLQGVVIVVGGESDPVPVHLEDGNTIHLCKAKRPLAKELALHIFGAPVRVTGNGRWLRDSAGEWIMKSFMITGYSVLKDDSLSAVIAALRQIPGEWKARPDTAAILKTLRSDES
jgi:hypothetical protein